MTSVNGLRAVYTSFKLQPFYWGHILLRLEIRRYDHYCTGSEDEGIERTWDDGLFSVKLWDSVDSARQTVLGQSL